MRRVDPAHGVLTQHQQLSVGKRAGRPISEVINRYHGRNRAAQGYGLRSGDKPFVERAALVGFNMGEPNVTKALDGQNASPPLHAPEETSFADRCERAMAHHP